VTHPKKYFIGMLRVDVVKKTSGKIIIMMLYVNDTLGDSGNEWANVDV
jgi:hypothetical protein